MAKGTGELLGPELLEVAQDLEYQLGRAEAQVELTDRTESTLREQLAREQERADRLETEIREAWRPPPEPRDGPETASEGAGEDHHARPVLQEPTQRRSFLAAPIFWIRVRRVFVRGKYTLRRRDVDTLQGA